MFTRLVAPLRQRSCVCRLFMSSTRVLESEPNFLSQLLANNLPKTLAFKHDIQSTVPQPVRYQSTNSRDKTPKERIKDLIDNNNKRVFVFMKGVPDQPACGYSNAVVQILNAYEVDYNSFNVLEDDEIRQEIKVYSNWPTIPQVYVDKNFVGGCDILIQMHQSNELEQLFGTLKPKT